MTDREVEAITQFLKKFGYFGCFEIAQRRAVSKMSEQEIAQTVLDMREAWARESLDVERIFKVVVMAHQYQADQWVCLPACCRTWGDVEPVMPPGRGSPLTMAQFDQARARAVPIPGTGQTLIDTSGGPEER